MAVLFLLCAANLLMHSLEKRKWLFSPYPTFLFFSQCLEREEITSSSADLKRSQGTKEKHFPATVTNLPR